jgi:hypothetical protein
MLVSEGLIALLVATITAAATILSVGLPYVWSKNKEINADIRQKKHEMYDGLVETLTAVVKNLWTSEKDMDAFILAYNKSSAYASDEVVHACKEFFIHLINQEKDDSMLTKRINAIYNAIRKDINPSAELFEYQLYTARSTSQESQLES